MIKNPLRSIFLSLSKHELREIKKMIDSPYFNERNDVLRLFAEINKSKYRNQENWDRFKLCPIIYPNDSSNFKKLGYAFSFLSDIIKQFLIHSEQKKNPIRQQMLLCRSLRNRNLIKQYNSNWKKLDKFIEADSLENIDRHQFKYEYYFEKEDYNNNNRNRRKGFENINQTTFHLTAHFAAGLLRQACILLTVNRGQINRNEIPLLDSIIHEVEKKTFINSQAVNIYHLAFKCLSETNNEDNFNEFKKLLAANWSIFPAKEMRDVYLIAINYCIQKMNNGESQYIKEAFELYKKGLQNKVLLEDGLLSRFDYKNSIRLGLALKEYKWAEKFIQEYVNYLPEKERGNVYKYNLAYFYFNKPDHDKAMELLRDVEFKDVFNNLDARRMLLRIYFEKEERSALDSLLDSFKVYVLRKKNLGYHRKNYLNLIRFARKMQKIDMQNENQKSRLRQKIEATDSVVEKKWLLSQLE